MICLKKLITAAWCLATGPQPLPKQVSQRVQSNASPFKFHYLLLSLGLSSSCLCLIPRRLVPSLSITCFRRLFLCMMWPIQLAFLLFVVCSRFLSSLTPSITSLFMRFVGLIVSILSNTTSETFQTISDLFSKVLKVYCCFYMCRHYYLYSEGFSW